MVSSSLIRSKRTKQQRNKVKAKATTVNVNVNVNVKDQSVFIQQQQQQQHTNNNSNNNNRNNNNRNNLQQQQQQSSSSQSKSKSWYNYYYLLSFFVIGIVLVIWNFISFENNEMSKIMDYWNNNNNDNNAPSLLLLLPSTTPRLSGGGDDGDDGSNISSIGNNIVNTTTIKTATAIKNKNKNKTNKTTIAYAITVTNFVGLPPINPNHPNHEQIIRKGNILDRAAVLHQSIKLAMSKSIKYDYNMHAFVHPDAINVIPWLKKLGYNNVHIKNTPFNITDIQNPALIGAQNNGCCKEKEYLKLYSYLLLDYPVVVHLDLDTLVLKPMDDVFDIMIDPLYDRRSSNNNKFTNHHLMWKEEVDRINNGSGLIDFVFTRDYNMVNPPKRQPHQIGTQGGFLVMKPNKEDFDRFVSVIISGGNFSTGNGWGGKLQYGGYYGAGTIQGLASYYYGHLQPNRSVELNRCYYNTMVDNPYYNSTKLNRTHMCRTLEPDNTCQDCRKTSLDEIYTTHFTVCGKPEWCNKPVQLLCTKLLIEWHKVRTTLEQEWSRKYPIHLYDPPKVEENTIGQYEGHCSISRRYIPMTFPLVDATDRLI